jgi:DNA polymerase I
MQGAVMKPVKNQSEKKPKSCGKLFLVDGNSFCYRAYYAIRALSNSKGEPTNALYGFITMLKKLLNETDPEYVAICFDRKEPTFRHQRFADYKKHRKPMPEDLVSQIEPIKEFCRLSGLAVFEMPGFEADDIIGTLAVEGEKYGCEVFIVTGDKDALQLVTDRIKVLNPHKDNFIGDREAVKKRFDGLGPEQVVDVMAIMGDSSDGIPGVPGIGEKGALKLINQFGSVENLIKNVEKVSSKSQREMIKANLELLNMSKELAQIDLKVPIHMDFEKMKYTDGDEAALMEFYKRYEFRGFIKDMPAAANNEEKERCYETIISEKDFQAFLEKLKKASAFAFDTETTSEDPMKAHLVGMSFSWDALCGHYIPLSSGKHKGQGLAVDKVLAAVKPVLEDEKIAKYGQHMKYDWIVMKRHGVEVKGVTFDTMIASYLINPIKLNHNLDDISMEYLNIRKVATSELLGTGKSQITMDEVPVEQVANYACEDADCVYRLSKIFQDKLKEHGLGDLFNKVEIPLALVLAKMEMNGVCLDTDFLKNLSDKSGRELERLTKEICKEAGEEFNINSPKQLGDILFTKMRLPIIKRTKTGYSTDVSVLEKLALTYELPKKILEFREQSKLKSTYLDALPSMINPETGLVHTSYNQTTTVTGRLSSSDPNLQNIPIKTETGRLVRKGFVPRGKNRKIFSADYSQIELRILAHLCGDKNLVKAFDEDRDIHKFTATLLYDVKEADVTYEMRNVAKTINFSIIYGKTAFGLSQDLAISVSEADGFIQNYFVRYKTVKDYLESQKELARKQGYLLTILGRRSYFPDINSKNGQIRQFAERAAINAPIQGSAADLIKLAMIAIQDELEAKKFESLMIMQVHDELVFDTPNAEVDKLTAMVREKMEGAYKMRVPLQADVFVGDSWYKN